jgi:NAD(P)H-nitrite reductase large subunit
MPLEVENVFHYPGPSMDGSACGRLVPSMTRCECAEMTFADLARRLRERGASLDALLAETGAGLLCTACLPDLRAHLAAPAEPR